MPGFEPRISSFGNTYLQSLLWHVVCSTERLRQSQAGSTHSLDSPPVRPSRGQTDPPRHYLGQPEIDLTTTGGGVKSVYCVLY